MLRVLGRMARRPLDVLTLPLALLGDLRTAPETAEEPVAPRPSAPAGAISHLVEEGVDLVEDALGTRRRVWEGEHLDHAQIEVRGLCDPDQKRLRRAVKKSLEQLEGVRWAEVNALTSRVAVAFDGSAGSLGLVVGAIESVEQAYGVGRRRLGQDAQTSAWETTDRAEHPADVEPVHRAVAAITGSALSLAWTAVGRAARVARIPVELVGLVSVVDNNPWLRERVEHTIGRRAADIVLPLGSALASGVSQGPVGVIVDLGYQTTLLAEVRARRRVWAHREPEFYARPSRNPIEPPQLDPRPVPLPKGPVETWSERIALASIAGFGVTLGATRDPRRAADAFLAGIPKAARLGREGFAAQLGRTLAARGVVPLDASALRRLDRVNTVVVDSDAVFAGTWEVRDVAVIEGDEAELRERAEALLDPADPAAHSSAGPWSLCPLADVATGLPRGAMARARQLSGDGARSVALIHDGRVVAVVGVQGALVPGADVLVASIRRAGHRFLVAGRKGGAARRLGADGRIPRGKAMGQAIRALQADGAVVAAIGRRSKTGLSAADVAIGLTRPSGRPPWGADLLLGRDLVDACLLIDATTVAAEVSARSAQFALAGSTLGALVAMTGPRGSAGSRCLAMVNGAAGASLLAGTWSAVQLAHRPRPLVVDATQWHELSVDEVLERLETTPAGLSPQSALQRGRAARPHEPEIGLAEPFLAEMANPLNPILGMGAGLSAAAGSMVDAGLVVGLIGLNALVGGAQRLRADRAVGQLLASTAASATVVRQGRETVLREDQLVRGDVVRLRAGDVVPADCRIVEAADLEVDEATLTGESLPVAKHAAPCPDSDVPERACMLYEDTTIAAGEATAVVVATGGHTEAARSLTAAGPPPATGVETRLDELTRRIMPAAIATAATVSGVGLLRRWPLRDVAGTGVSLAIAAVPEGLPFVASAAQLAAARRLAQHNAVVRNPRTVEALGRVDVLCFDKTGTLTEGRVRLRGVSDGESPTPTEDFEHHDRAVLAAALRASGTPGAAGPERLDQTDEALLDAAGSLGVDETAGNGSWRPVTELPFEATRGLHAVLGRTDRGHVLAVKGAPEALLQSCARWRRNGKTVAFDRDARAAVEEHVNDLTGRGWRVLAVAERPASSRTQIDTDRLHDLVLRGLVVLADPVRRTAAEAVAGVRAAGVRPVMVTGDHPNTAAAIAEELAMGPGRVMTGADLDDLSEDELDAVVDDVTVFARVTPTHKTRIVQSLQRRGHAVAMTGDGANDAAAIRLADVGVALGERATPAARDAADIVVTDNRIETLIAAIEEGRALWSAVREALAVLVGGNLGEIGTTAFASVFSRRAPLNPRQFLLVNLLTDLAPAVAIAIRPPRRLSPERLRREGPERSLGQALTRDIVVRGVATGTGASAAWLTARLTGGRARAGTVALVALTATQLGQTMLAGGIRQPLVLATGLGSAAVLAGIVQTPGVSHFFGCRPLGPLDWAQALTAAGIASVGGQVASRLLVERGPASFPGATSRRPDFPAADAGYSQGPRQFHDAGERR